MCSKDIHIARNWIAAQESALFVQAELPMAPTFHNKFELLQASLAQACPGLHCEFGVYKGETINFIASKVGATVHGFDSFEGLPEDWRSGFTRGRFSLAVLPKVAGNVVLHKGWFSNSIPKWLHETPGAIGFLHIDCDLYSSTKSIFGALSERIVPGTVIQFDDYFNYPGWRTGEHRAFTEFCSENQITFDYLGYVPTDEQIAVKITSVCGRVEAGVSERREVVLEQ
jgi:hypothetical protein